MLFSIVYYVPYLYVVLYGVTSLCYGDLKNLIHIRTVVRMRVIDNLKYLMCTMTL